MNDDETKKPEPNEVIARSDELNDISSDRTAVEAIAPKASILKVVAQNLIITVFAVLVFYILSTIFVFIIIATNIDAFKGEVYGILQSSNGYGSALASGLGGLLTVYFFRKRGKIPAIVIVILMLLIIPGSIYSETDDFNTKATTQVQEQIQEDGLSVIDENRKSLRDDFNSQGAFLFPVEVNNYHVAEAEWKIEEVPGIDTAIKTLNLSLLRNKDGAEIEMYYSKFRAEPNVRDALETFVTDEGVEFVRLPHSSFSSSNKMVLYSISENVENKISVIYDDQKIKHSEAKEITNSLENLSPELIQLNQEVCNQNSHNELRVCSKNEF